MPSRLYVAAALLLFVASTGVPASASEEVELHRAAAALAALEPRLEQLERRLEVSRSGVYDDREALASALASEAGALAARIERHARSLGPDGPGAALADRYLRRSERLLGTVADQAARRRMIRAIAEGGEPAVGVSGGGSVAGTVTVDGSGTPIASVFVDVVDAGGSFVGFDVTDGSGGYSVGGLPAGTYYALTANSLGYIDELYDDIPCAGGCNPTDGTPIAVSAAGAGGVDFALALGGTVTGTVTAAGSGTGLASIFIFVYDASGFFVSSGVTNAAGDYSVGGLPTGSYHVRTFREDDSFVDELYDDLPCPGFTCTVTDGTPVAVTQGGTAAGIDFALATGASFSGSITEEGSGVPLASVFVDVYEPGGGFAGSAVTGSGGAYTVGGLLAGTHYARTSNSSGYVDELYDDIPCPGACTPTTGTPISATAGGTTGIDFALELGGAIAGTVTEFGGGTPLSSILVRILDSTGSQVGIGVTDFDGTYVAEGLAPGTHFARTTNSAGWVNELYDDIPCPGSCDVTAGTPIAVAAGGTTGGIDFALDLGGSISGTVTDAVSTLPLASISVFVFDSGGSFVGSGFTGASGFYSVPEALPAGTYFARTGNSSGYLNELYDDLSCTPFCTETDGDPITVTAGSTTGGIDFALELGGALAGTVTDAGTTDPLGSVSIFVYDATGSFATSGFTGGGGAFTTGGVPSGTYYAFTFNSSGYLDELYDDLPCVGFCDPLTGAPITVTAPSVTSGIDFALDLGGRVAGSVTAEFTGAPIESFVDVYDASGLFVTSGFTDAVGDYLTGTGLSAGTYFALTFNLEGYRDELFDDVPCPGFSCVITDGTPIAVAVPATSTADFELIDEIFSDGFESGDLSAWSSSTP